MTLIAYADKALYADKLFVLDEADLVVNRVILGQKLFVDETNRVAVGVLGQAFHPGNMALVLKSICTIIVNREISDTHPAVPEDLVKMLTNEGTTSFIVLSKRSIYHIDSKFNIRIKFPDTDHAYGTGDGCFFMCRANGIPVPQTYKLVSELLTTVSSEFDVVRQSSLKPIVKVKETDEKPAKTPAKKAAAKSTKPQEA